MKYQNYLILEKWDPSVVPLTDLFRALQLSLEAAMEEPMTQINGVVTVLDMNSLSLTQIMQFTPSFACMMLEWIQVSIRLKRCKYLKTPLYFIFCFN